MAEAVRAAGTFDGISAEQARAWLRTVVHPLAQAVAIARERLESKRFSFRWHSRDFELIVGSRRAIPPKYKPNGEHFARHNPDVAELMREYDLRLDALRTVCIAAYDWLIQQPAILEPAQVAPGTLTQDRQGPALAEYTINGVHELPADYVLSKVWDEKRDKLLALRSSAEGAPLFSKVDEAAERLDDVVVRLDDRLAVLIQELADRFGLAPVDPDALFG